MAWISAELTWYATLFHQFRSGFPVSPHDETVSPILLACHRPIEAHGDVHKVIAGGRRHFHIPQRCRCSARETATFPRQTVSPREGPFCISKYIGSSMLLVGCIFLCFSSRSIGSPARVCISFRPVIFILGSLYIAISPRSVYYRKTTVYPF